MYKTLLFIDKLTQLSHIHITMLPEELLFYFIDEKSEAQKSLIPFQTTTTKRSVFKDKRIRL